YREGFLKKTDFGAEWRAADAADLFRRFVLDLQANPGSVVNAPATWSRILELLQDAAALMQARAALGAGPTAAGAFIPQPDRDELTRRIANNLAALGTR